MSKKSFLCRIGLHKRYKYLPKVSGDLREISIACKRCGYGLRYFAGTWDISPEEVQDSIKNQPEIEYGCVLGMLRDIKDPLESMEIAFDIIKNKFNTEELSPLRKEFEEMKNRRKEYQSMLLHSQDKVST